MRIILYYLTFLSLGLSWVTRAQAPQASFSIPVNSCMSETITIANTSNNATSYTWDFCDEDMKSTPFGSLLTTLPVSGSFFHSIKIINDNGEWIGFCTDTNGNKLYRLDFGLQLNNTPTIVNLGALAGFLSPGSIEMIKESGIWYAFILNLFGHTLLRAKFVDGIKSPPTMENLGNVGGLLSTPSGIKVILNEGNYFAYVTNLGTHSVQVIDFGNSIQNAPVRSKLVGQSSIIQNPYGISAVSQAGKIYALVGGAGVSKTFRLDFGLDPYSEPSLSQINGVPSGLDLDFVLEGSSYYALLRTQSDGLYRIDFGTDLSSGTPLVARLGPLGLLVNEARNVVVVRDSPGFKLLSVEATSGKVFKFDFLGNCSNRVSQNSSTSQIPDNVFFKVPGFHSVELTARNNQGLISVASNTIQTLNLSASGVGITLSPEKCVGSSISFGTSSSATIISYNWDFGNGFTSLISSPQHIFSTPGDYVVMLSSIEANGCKNFSSKPVSIFPAPVPNFSPPIITGKSCTLQNYIFTNQSTFDPLSNPTWTWAVNGVEKSDAQNLNYAFDMPITYNISLKAEIPGCSNSIVQDFLVEETGALVDFNFANQCLGSQTIFTNNSTTNTGLTWDFGDGQSASIENPSHQFASIGNYNVVLTANNSAGCVNTLTKPVQIVSTPNPYFFTDLPPFSCSGTPTQFHDDTASPTDSNITSWQWFFNDGSGATSTQKDPQHTFLFPGVYDVGLQVESNYGCVASVQLPIEIAETPSADFNVSAACLNKPTQFENASSPGIKSWSWTMGNSFYTFPDPVHSFTLAGTYPVNLTVKGFNGCESFSTKTVTVNSIPSLNFSSSQSCSDQPTLFTDQTTGTDMATSWVWDFGEGHTAIGSSASFTCPSSGAFPVGMNILTASGCEYSLLKNVVVAPSPVASFTSTTSFGPPPLIVQFTNTSFNSSSLLWEFRDPLHSTSTNQNPLFTFSEIGDYLVQLTASNNVGCSDSFSQTIQVLVPHIDLALEALDVQAGFSGQSFSPIITVRNNSNINISAFDVFVIGSSGTRVKTNIVMPISKGEASTAVVPIELFSRENYLCVELFAFGDTNAANNTACENLGAATVINAPYPNPTTGTLYLEAVLKEPGPGSIKVFDTFGQLVVEEKFSGLPSGMNRFELDCSGNRPGLYFAIWEVSGVKSEFKFLLK